MGGTGNGTNLSQSPLAREAQIDPVIPMDQANDLAAPGLTFDSPIRTSIFEAMNANRLEEMGILREITGGARNGPPADF